MGKHSISYLLWTDRTILSRQAYGTSYREQLATRGLLLLAVAVRVLTLRTALVQNGLSPPLALPSGSQADLTTGTSLVRTPTQH